MHLYAALVPPRDALTQLWDAAAAVQGPLERPARSGSAGRHLAGSSGRRIGRRRKSRHETPTGPPLDLVPVVQMELPLVKFGNVSLADAVRLGDALDRKAPGWETPRLHLSGGTAPASEGDRGVWAGLAGDVEALSTLVRGVTDVARSLHLFVDRRGFRPHVQLGTTTSATTTAYLDELMAVLGEFESTAWWQTKLSLLSPAEPGPDQPAHKVYRDITLGPAVAH